MKVVQALNGHSNKVLNLRYLQGLNILISVDEHGVIMLWNLADLTLIEVILTSFIIKFHLLIIPCKQL